MGLFSKSKSDKPKVNHVSPGKIQWNELTDLSQLDEIKELSKTTPVMILKHSTRCFTSMMAKKELDNGWDVDKEKAIPYYLDLLKFRPISNQIAQDFNVVHQSPQILIIKNGVCEYNSSHSDIQVRAIKKRL